MARPAFFQRLEPATVQLFEEFGITRQWRRRARIFRTGEACTGVHVVLKGLVKLYRANASGREQIVLLEGANSVLTIAPVVDRGTHLAIAETLQPTTTLFTDRDVFLRLYAERADLREAVSVEMARRLRLAVGLLETIALKPVTARVATRVLELATTRAALDGSRRFRLLLSQDELAHVLGTSRESVARSLAELRSAGIIEQRGSQVRVLDAEALFELAHTSEAEAATPLPDVF